MYYPAKQQPVAVCTVCGAFGYTTSYIGVRCGKPDGGRRCPGVRARATDRADWKECPRCRGTGRGEDRECTFCLGRGWLYVRNTVRPAADEPSSI